MKYSVLGAGLFAASIWDLKRHMVWVPGMIILGITGYLLEMFSSAWWEILLGGLPGLLLYGVSRVTRGAMGEGDALIFGVCGIYLGLVENLLLLWLSLFLAMLAGGLLLLRKKGNRKSRIPLVPFVFMAYVILWSGGVGI